MGLFSLADLDAAARVVRRHVPRTPTFAAAQLTEGWQGRTPTH